MRLLFWCKIKPLRLIWKSHFLNRLLINIDLSTKNSVFVILCKFGAKHNYNISFPVSEGLLCDKGLLLKQHSFFFFLVGSVRSCKNSCSRKDIKLFFFESDSTDKGVEINVLILQALKRKRNRIKRNLTWRKATLFLISARYVIWPSFVTKLHSGTWFRFLKLHTNA